MPESLFDLGEPDLASQAQVLAVLTRGQLGHGRNSLAAGIAGPDSVSLHMAMVARLSEPVNSGRGARLIHSGCGAAWLARLLGVQEVPGSNPGSPTKEDLSGPDTGSRADLRTHSATLNRAALMKCFAGW